MAVKSETLLGRNQDPFTPRAVNSIREGNIYARYEQPPVHGTIVDLKGELNLDLASGQTTANGFNVRRPR